MAEQRKLFVDLINNGVKLVIIERRTTTCLKSITAGADFGSLLLDGLEMGYL